ncbi:permease [uncultured Williamsia sp.]|uniref:permease n=1 Tax=uncultured Williamsia sp. TaxID=259311 RepID=UPI00260A4F86|nr:permease [uncultured Williamsia sp.]
MRSVDALAVGSLIVSLVVGVTVNPSTLWGFLPIALYGVLAAMGMPIVRATVVAVVSSLLILLPGPGTALEMAGDAVTDQVTIIGFAILFGGALAEVLRVTGAATTIVSTTLRGTGTTSTTAVAAGIMTTCCVLVTALGTLAGALAVAVPVLLPVAARAGLTRSATASAVFIGGCAGFGIAPFAGGTIAVMQAADIGYVEYLLRGGIWLPVLSFAIGMLIVPWIQRRTARTDDHYPAEELGAVPQVVDAHASRRASRAALVFTVTLVVVLAVATVLTIGVMLPLVALPLLAVVTAIAGGMRPAAFAHAVRRGVSSLAWLFFLFLLLAVLFTAIARINPFSVVLGSFGDDIGHMTPFLLAMTIAVIGWIGIPGATGAQVVLMDKVFGPLADVAGIGAGVWVVVLLFSSKADTYGPLPNPTMVGVMGLCRSTNLRAIFLTAWTVLIPIVAVYTLLILIGTR